MLYDRDVKDLIKVLTYHRDSLDKNSHKYQRFGHYIKALNFLLGNYRSDNEILKVVKNEKDICNTRQDK